MRREWHRRQKDCLNGKVIGSIRRTGLVTVLVNILLHTSTHTAFRKAVTSLETDLSDILTDLFGFFKHTTARRADVRDVKRGSCRQVRG